MDGYNTRTHPLKKVSWSTLAIKFSLYVNTCVRICSAYKVQIEMIHTTVCIQSLHESIIVLVC